MKKIRKITSMIVCAVMLLCVFSVDAAALEVSDETIVVALTGNEIAYATLEVTKDYAVAATSYRGFATSLAINLHVNVATNDTDLIKTEYYVHTCEDTSSTAYGAWPGADEEFVWAMSRHTIVTHLDSDTIQLSTSAG